MRVLLAGEAQPGSLLRSLEPRMHATTELTVVDPYRSQPIGSTPSLATRARRRMRSLHVGDLLIEATQQLCPDVVLLIKGRGVSRETVEACRQYARVAIYYPDNPFWRGQDQGDALGRLATADLAVIWSDRLAAQLSDTCRRVAVVPFGFDERSFALADSASSLRLEQAAFVGVWSPRRERFVRALESLPVVVAGGGWSEHLPGLGREAVVGSSAGELLRSSRIGINLLHPQNAGAHNMRTREIAASGAAEVTDAGTDGTPLRDQESCLWFDSPSDLRRAVEELLENGDRAVELAQSGQSLIRHENYDLRADQLLEAITGGR